MGFYARKLTNSTNGHGGGGGGVGHPRRGAGGAVAVVELSLKCFMIIFEMMSFYVYESNNHTLINSVGLRT